MAAPKFYIQFDSNGVLVTRFDDNKKYLPHPDGTVEVPKALWQQTVQETDGAWMRDSTTGDITKQPFPAPPLDQARVIRKAEIAAEADGLIDAQVGASPRGQLMMVAKGLAMLDEQVGRGGSPARNPQMDVLAGIFAYVEAVNVAEQEASDAIDVATDPSTVSLVAPPLPVL